MYFRPTSVAQRAPAKGKAQDSVVVEQPWPTAGLQIRVQHLHEARNGGHAEERREK